MKIWIDYDRMTNEQFQNCDVQQVNLSKHPSSWPSFSEMDAKFSEKKWDLSQQKEWPVSRWESEKKLVHVQSNMIDSVNVWFIHVFHGHLKWFGCSSIFTHAMIKKQKHHAWRFASVAFCCHSCKGDNKVASSSSSSSSTTTTTNYSSTSHHLTISHKTSPIHHKLQSCFLLLKAAREKSVVCTKVKHHSHHRTVGFDVGIPQIMCYPTVNGRNPVPVGNYR